MAGQYDCSCGRLASPDAAPSKSKKKVAASMYTLRGVGSVTHLPHGSGDLTSRTYVRVGYKAQAWLRLSLGVVAQEWEQGQRRLLASGVEGP